MQLVHVYVAILFLVLESSHLRPCGACWLVIKVKLISGLHWLLFILVVRHNLEVKLSGGSFNCRSYRDVLFYRGASHLKATHTAGFRRSIDYLLLAVNLHISILGQKLLLIILGQSVVILFWLCSGCLLSCLLCRLLCSILLCDNPKLLHFFLLHPFLVICKRLLGD